MSSVYLETSFFSECCTIRTNEIARGRQATSLNWWDTDARKFDLYIGSEVVRELSSTTFPEQVRTSALKCSRDCRNWRCRTTCLAWRPFWSESA